MSFVEWDPFGYCLENQDAKRVHLSEGDPSWRCIVSVTPMSPTEGLQGSPVGVENDQKMDNSKIDHNLGHSPESNLRGIPHRPLLGHKASYPDASYPDAMSVGIDQHQLLVLAN